MGMAEARMSKEELRMGGVDEEAKAYKLKLRRQRKLRQDWRGALFHSPFCPNCGAEIQIEVRGGDAYRIEQFSCGLCRAKGKITARKEGLRVGGA